MRPTAMVVLALLLTAGSASKSYKAGLESESAGQEWKAAQHFLDALDKRPKREKTRVALARVAESALDEAIQTAESKADERDYLQALSWYTLTQEYTQRLDGFGGLTFDVPPDLDARIAQMTQAAAKKAYDAGAKAVAARHWSEALAQFENAVEILPNYEDSDVRIAEVHYGWGADEATGGQHRSAAEHYALAQSSRGTFEDSADRAAALYAALGRHHLSSGACRQAVRDLRIANATHPQAVGAELDNAESCATNVVVMRPFTAAATLHGVDMSAWVERYVRETFPETSSEFAQLVPWGMNDGTESFVVQGTMKVVGNPQVVASTAQKVARGKKVVDCPQEQKRACFEEVPIPYQEVNSILAIKVKANVQIMAGRNGGQVAELQPVGTAKSKLRWATDFRKGSGQPISVVARPKEGEWGVGSSLISMRDAPKTHPPATQLTEQALETIGHDTLTQILAVADVELPWTDPVELTVVSLTQ